MSRVLITIGANKSGFDTAMKSVNHSLSEFKGLVAGYFTMDAVKELTAKTFEFADSLVDSARRMNITVEQVQILKKAAQDSGVEFDKLAVAMDKVNIAKSKALSGDKDAMKNLMALGVTGKDQLKNSNSADLLFGVIADTVKKNAKDVTLPLSETLGRGFGAIVPLLKEDIDEVGKSLKSMGSLMDTKTAVELKVLNEEFQSLGTMLMVTFAPAIIATVEAMEKAISKYLHLLDGTDKPKEPDTNKQGFWSKAWDNTKGIGAGIVGLSSVIGGGGGLFGQDNKAYQFGVDELMKADNLFNKTGNTGIIDSLATNIAKGGSIADSFDSMIAAQHEKINSITNGLNHPQTVPSEQAVTKTDKHTAKIYSDSLTGVGNMLGASYKRANEVTALDLQRRQLAATQEQTRLLEQIANKEPQPNIFGGDNKDWMKNFPQ